MLLRRRAFWVLHAGVMGHFVLRGLGVRNSGTKEADEVLQDTDTQPEVPRNSFLGNESSTGPSTHLEPITVHLPVPQDGL